MSRTIVISNTQQNTLEQIYNELLFPLRKTLSEEDLLKLPWYITKECSIQTYQSKKDITRNTFQTFGKFGGKALAKGKRHFNNYREKGFENQFHSDYITFKTNLNATPGKLRGFGQNCTLKLKNFNEFFLRNYQLN